MKIPTTLQGPWRGATPARTVPTLCLAAGIAGLVLPAQAQQVGDDGKLGDVPADNEVQHQTGTYIDTICPQMAELNRQGQLNAPQQRLLNRCGGAKFNIGREGFTEGDATGVLQRLSPEETLTIGSNHTDTALKDQLGTRFSALRAGVTGVSIGGVAQAEHGIYTGGSAGVDDGAPWGFFLNGVYSTGDKDGDENEDQFDFDAYGLTTGLDYRLSESLVVGVAYGYVDADADIDDGKGAVSSGNGGAGDSEQDTETHTLALYGTWYSGNVYFDGSVAWSQSEIDGERSIQYGFVNQAAEMSTDSDQLAISVGGGFNHHLGGPWNTRYFLRSDYVDAEVDAYRERARQRSAEGADPANPAQDLDSLIMQVDDQEIESWQSVLGVNLTYVQSVDYGVLTPYVTAAWHHEFEDDSRLITAKYVFDPTNDVLRFRSSAADEDFFGLSVGVSSVLANGTQWFVNYDTVLGLDDVSQHIFTGGFRVSF
ncbi:autotransporter outer membrane beta-barrel domain-containing protein [Parahaliea mediterranea]|uniref:Autotransporter outer membrane beta-barrel domain-containing protein n=1 Tax=Parahaliea mediterranea TaxID=651086 RepID=A0A939IK20_9GAMM|nr:autotransporter outer membrane beta-barrel domain-containing protein [Parahaliea mediterranea]MBN7795000.1 autotransporter outer membrane beta-barrel domain-containing protein [Parahaliea mediterranea]